MADYDRELIAEMLDSYEGARHYDRGHSVESIAELARLLREADNADAAGVHTATQPPAVGVDVSEEMVERAFNEWCDVAVVDDYRVRNSREALHAALTAALRTGGGEA